ncbi:MAG: stage 0 sporulation protein [Erysipelotrichaceae bacterium]|nr:stage 0 sporulation protein [Erysipelotrichaceae bacterium]MDY5251826.1 regulatory iron-sulfur-containing complex subunit RicT [Erysipelotrichaceae bacterium]
MSEQACKYLISIKYTPTGKAYTFGCDDANIQEGEYVVLETAQGQELGEVVKGSWDSKDYQGKLEIKPIVRKATLEDRVAHEENILLAKQAMKFCQQQINDLGLQMNLISAQYTLDRRKILIIYLADERVDFRELLKRLAAQLHCRIELKQIGDRDKAKIVGGMGSCGREICCHNFLNTFEVVGINMAKNQLLSLNAAKLSGQCGKLMCCLRFEDEVYKEMIAGLPKMNSQVEYAGKIYRLTGLNLLNNYVKLENKEEVVNISLKQLREEVVPHKVEPPKKKVKNNNNG